MLKDYTKIKKEYFDYLNSTIGSKIYCHQLHKYTYEQRLKIFEYKHRWTVSYKKSVLAKLYKLEDWYRKNPCKTTFFTFTTHQNDFNSYEEQYIFLKKNYRKIRKLMINYLGTFNYVWVIEPHKSGFMHLHMLVFDTFTHEQKLKIIDKWSYKYGAGNEFAQDISESKELRIDYLRTYIFKYISKMYDYNLGLNFEDVKNDPYFIMSAVAWNMSRDPSYPSIRFWGSSRYLTSIMKMDRKESDEWITLSIESETGLWYEIDKEELRNCLNENFIDID